MDIRDELRQNAVDYAYEVNVQRAFPDVRDGLKLGQRACIWEMYVRGYTSNKPHVKSAKVAGGVISNWHPHGDVAAYETFARMSMPWINNIPEVDWHGANGNQIIGNAPASPRYTETRLSKATEEGMLQGLKKNNVDMQLNFSEDEEWPVVLPAIMPRLLVNGCQGIGFSISNCWLPNNLKEISKVINEYILTGTLNYDNIFPDFPTGGIILNKDEIHKIYETGKGRVVLRGKAEIDKDSILITELPYQVFVEPLIEQIKKLVESEDILYIKDILNKSDRKKLLIEIECEKNKASIVLAKLFEITDLQKTYNANQYALVSKTPQLLTLKDYIDIYVKHNVECIKREYQFDLNKVQNRKEIVLGLIKALEDIDNIISLIKKADNSKDAQNKLIEKYSFTENQAKAIIDMRLGKLAHLEKIELNQEKEELTSQIETFNQVLSSQQSLIQILLDRLNTFVKKYGYERRTKVIQLEEDKKAKEEKVKSIPSEKTLIKVKSNNTIERENIKDIKVQKKYGKGTKANNESLITLISSYTDKYIMLFTNMGRMYKILINDIPELNTNLSDLIKLKEDEKVIAAAVPENTETKYAVFFTRNGLLKKTSFSEYNDLKRGSGVAAIKLLPGDSVINVIFINEENVFILTKNGIGIQFETKDIKPIGRNTSGVKAVKLEEGDSVVCGLASSDNSYASLAIFTENGYGKRVSVDELFIQGRGGKGVQYYKSTDETGKIIGGIFIKDSDSKILLSGVSSNLCLAASDIIQAGRYSQGYLLAKNYILSATLL